MLVDSASQTHLAADSNQALGIGRFAVDFMNGRIGEPDRAALNRVGQFHADSVFCGLSALALRTNAPTVLRDEALEYPDAKGASVFGSRERVKLEKAIVANASAVREWDSNGTNFGYNPELGHTAGEFGHNDFYPVVIAAAQARGLDGATALRGMLLLDEIRGRLAEVFSLKSYKIDHVVHGAIGSAATFGAMMGATPEQIESAIGMTVAHYIPFRAIRAGKQLSDSKGASAAISTEAAILATQRSMRGFIGPKDIFRNPQAIFRLFEPTKGDRAPFDLVLSHSGSDFAVMGMHFKLGMYEHQSAGAIQAVLDLVTKSPELLEDADGDAIRKIVIRAYEPAFGIIGDPAKRDPRTRQSADHSMVYIIATLLGKALDLAKERGGGRVAESSEELWKATMLAPHDYSPAAIDDRRTRAIMEKIAFEHGGPEYDAKYPDGIPTSVIVTAADGRSHDSGLVMYPIGHARNTTADLDAMLEKKFEMLGGLAVDRPAEVVERLDLADKSSSDMSSVYDFDIIDRGAFE
ncbi:MAG: MmgE/PrpD family protein [Phycisphaerales bacterium]